MDDGVTNDDQPNIGTTKTGSLEFQGTTKEMDPMARETAPPPEGVPEKFWDAEKGVLRTDALLKSYIELEKTRGRSDDEDEDEDGRDPEETDEEAEEAADEDDKGDDEDKSGEDDEKSNDDDEETDEDDNEDGEDDEPSPMQQAVENAQQAYAENGELSEENYAELEKVGYSRQQVDLYLAGVKATEAALIQTAEKAAGSLEEYEKAKLWAAENWSEKQITTFDSQVNDLETAKTAVAGLMAAYREANPGEGKLQDKTTGMTRGSVYDDISEYDADLTAAGNNRAKRRKAVEKYRRSLKAGTITPSRAQPFGR